MSQKNIEVIRRSYEAFNRRDLAAILQLMHPDFELGFSGSLGPERGVYAGEEGIRRLFEPYWDAFESISIEPEEFIGTDDVIIAVVRSRVVDAAAAWRSMLGVPTCGYFATGRSLASPSTRSSTKPSRHTGLRGVRPAASD